MPEGPSILILKELVKPYTGKKIIEARGNAGMDMSVISGKKILSFKTWGKHFLIFARTYDPYPFLIVRNI